MKVYGDKVGSIVHPINFFNTQPAFIDRIFTAISCWLKPRSTQHKTNKKVAKHQLLAGVHIALLYTSQRENGQLHRTTITLGKYLLQDGIVVKQIDSNNLHFDLLPKSLPN